MADLIDRQAAIDAIHEDADWLAAQGSDWQVERMERDKSILKSLPTVQPTIVRCRDCKYNPQKAWFGCPMAHLNGRQRPEDAWCWRGEREAE